MASEYVLYLWVGWPLQHRIIDGPACQGVLIRDEVCRVGVVGRVPATTCGKSDICAFWHSCLQC
jgi:hypothetical protein